MTATRLLLVVAGGMLGTAARLALALAIRDAAGIPLATLAANVAGALLIGVLAGRLPSSSDLRVFLGTGILGGFTTYSAFAVGVAGSSDVLVSAVYAVLTLGFGIGAAVLGMRLARPRSGNAG